MLRKTITTLYLFLLVAGFEYTVRETAAREITYTAYIVGIFACCLLIIYIIPMMYGINVLMKKLQCSWKIFIGAFVSGFFISTFLASYGNMALDNLWTGLLPKAMVEQWSDALSAPIAEEFIKALICVLFLYIMKQMKLKHFLISGIGVGLGFQVLEDISYIIPEGMGDGVMNEIIPSALYRISIFAASHWAYTAVVSIGVYLVYKQRKKVRGYIYLFSPVILHFIWNSPLSDNHTAIAIFSPILTIITVLLFISSLKEVLLQEKTIQA